MWFTCTATSCSKTFSRRAVPSPLEQGHMSSQLPKCWLLSTVYGQLRPLAEGLSCCGDTLESRLHTHSLDSPLWWALTMEWWLLCAYSCGCMRIQRARLPGFTRLRPVLMWEWEWVFSHSGVWCLSKSWSLLTWWIQHFKFREFSFCSQFWVFSPQCSFISSWKKRWVSQTKKRKTCITLISKTLNKPQFIILSKWVKICCQELMSQRITSD